MANTYIYYLKYISIYSLLLESSQHRKQQMVIHHADLAGFCHHWWAYLDEKCHVGLLLSWTENKEEMAGSPKVKMVVDTLVSNFYYCSLENLVKIWMDWVQEAFVSWEYVGTCLRFFPLGKWKTNTSRSPAKIHCSSSGTLKRGDECSKTQFPRLECCMWVKETNMER